MESKDLALFLAERLADKKAFDITILDVEKLVSYTDFFIIASGRSDRQVQALAEHVTSGYRERVGRRPLGTEGADRGGWALLDFGDVIVHIFREQERAFYDLEGLWEDAPRLAFTPPVEAPAAAAR